VYADPTTITSAGGVLERFTSLASRLPSSGLRRRLSSTSLVTRILSTVGLKSNPTVRLFSAPGIVSKAGPSATAIAVRTLRR
jgi:hypothetical protein